MGWPCVQRVSRGDLGAVPCALRPAQSGWGGKCPFLKCLLCSHITPKHLGFWRATLTSTTVREQEQHESNQSWGRRVGGSVSTLPPQQPRRVVGKSSYPTSHTREVPGGVVWGMDPAVGRRRTGVRRGGQPNEGNPQVQFVWGFVVLHLLYVLSRCTLVGFFFPVVV